MVMPFFEVFGWFLRTLILPFSIERKDQTTKIRNVGRTERTFETSPLYLGVELQYHELPVGDIVTPLWSIHSSIHPAKENRFRVTPTTNDRPLSSKERMRE